MQLFTDEYLERCRQLSPVDIVRFLEDYRELLGAAKARIPTLRKDHPAPAPSMEERDIALQLACRAAMRILKDRAEMVGSDAPLDAPVPLPDSSRHLIRRLAKQRQARLAGQ